MSAETLRRAASLMRERAEAAQRDSFSQEPWKATVFDDGRAWFGPGHHSMHGYPNTAEYIAGMHPVVALAVADWLDAEAERWRKEQDRSWGCVLIRTDFEPPTETSARNALQAECDATADRLCGPALTVARAYLGESA